MFDIVDLSLPKKEIQFTTKNYQKYDFTVLNASK